MDKIATYKKYLLTTFVLFGVVVGSYFIFSNYGIDKENNFYDEKEFIQIARECKDLERGPQIQCWEDLLVSVISSNGLASAFDIFSKLIWDEPVFKENCHDYAHRIGEAALQIFIDDEGKINVTQAASFCGYGFYHGFMERLLLTNGNPETAREFCKLVDEQLDSIDRGAAASCYHGVGHGAAYPHDPRDWGDAMAIINPALKLCEEVAAEAGYLMDCVMGVLDPLYQFMELGEYGLELNRENPFWLCRELPARYQEACYPGTIMALSAITGNDFLTAARLVEAIENDEYAAKTVMRLAGTVIYLNLGNTDYSKNVKACRELQERLYIPCILGFTNVLKESGNPGKEYIGVLNFCKENGLLEHEKEECYKYILGELLRNMYSDEKFQDICEMVEDKYRKYCYTPLPWEEE